MGVVEDFAGSGKGDPKSKKNKKVKSYVKKPHQYNHCKSPDHRQKFKQYNKQTHNSITTEMQNCKFLYEVLSRVFIPWSLFKSFPFQTHVRILEYLCVPRH